MTKDQRKKIIGYLFTLSRRKWMGKWEEDGVINYGKNNTLLLGDDKIPVERDGTCASIHERFVNPTLLELFIQSTDQFPLEELPLSEPSPDDLPRFDDLTRHYFVRMMYQISNRLYAYDYHSFVFDDKYLIEGSGAVCGWDLKKDRPIKWPKEQSISALDYELMHMAKGLKDKLKNKDTHGFYTQDGKTWVTVKQAFKALDKIHGGSDE